MDGNVGYRFTSDSPEMMSACFNCKLPDCCYAKCSARIGAPGQKRERKTSGKSKPKKAPVKTVRKKRPNPLYEEFKRLVAQGKPDNRIATKLGVTSATVKKYHQWLIAEQEAED